MSAGSASSRQTTDVSGVHDAESLPGEGEGVVDDGVSAVSGSADGDMIYLDIVVVGDR